MTLSGECRKGQQGKDMATRILLIRHGETAWNRERVFRGTYDIPLNDNGRNQAKLIAKAMESSRIDAAYTSPLSRADETARIVLASHGIKATRDEALIDVDYGSWTGKRDADVARQWPVEHAAWISRPHSLRVPEGNTLKEVFDRSFGAMENIAKKHDKETVVLFSHRVVNKLLIIGALGLELNRFPFIMQGNCCINEFERTQNGYLIKSINNMACIKNAGTEWLAADF